MAVSERHGSKPLLLCAVTMLAEQGIGLPGSRWLFLGNQRLRPDQSGIEPLPENATRRQRRAWRATLPPGYGLGKMESVRNWLGWWGAKVFMIDSNGKDGAIAADLSLPWVPPYDETVAFDCVANFGTTEHVEANQMQPFKTIHEQCRIGGLMLHSVPSQGCQRHGVWKYDLDWFRGLAAQQGYRTVWGDYAEVEHGRYAGPHTYVNVVLQKVNDDPFRSGAWLDPRRG